MDKNVGVPTGYKVKLNVSERLNLPALFVAKGSMLQNQVMEDIADKIKVAQGILDDVEYKEWEVPTQQGILTRSNWNSEKAEEIEREVTFSKTEMQFLKKRIELLDKTEDIPRNINSLVKKLDAFKPGEEKKKDE